MTPRSPVGPDALLRDTLRGLRHALRRGGETLGDLPVTALPDPAARLAGAVLRHGVAFAKDADHIASSVAKAVLSSGTAQNLTLAEIMTDPHGPDIFAAVVYDALSTTLRQRGELDALVIETAIRKAFVRLAPLWGRKTDAELAAAMTVEFLELNVVYDAQAAGALEICAVLLWVIAERPQCRAEATLAASLDLVLALREDLLPACAARDASGLAAFYTSYINHV